MSKLNLVERQQNNREILNKVKSWVEAYPDLRFGQILINLGIVKEDQVNKLYYEEPKETLTRVKRVYEST